MQLGVKFGIVMGSLFLAAGSLSAGAEMTTEPLAAAPAANTAAAMAGVNTLPVAAADTVSAAGATDTAVMEEDMSKSVSAGTVLLLCEGGIDFPYSRLLDAESDLNQVKSTVTYSDGSLQNPSVKHTGYRWGLAGEYLLTDDWGAQAGFTARTLEQSVGTGGDGYATKGLAQGALLSYGNPFLGASYYLINQSDANLYAGARAGFIMGKIYPQVTSNEYLGLPVQSDNLSGYDVSLGMGIRYVYEWLVVGFSVYATEDFFRTSEKIYRDLDQNFTLTSLDLSLSLGYKF